MSETHSTHVAADVVIFGGGVAGLWLLNRLRSSGYRAVLVETDHLGAGQTRHAQGIIHGGTKYALTGTITSSAEAVARMPAYWRECLAGRGEVDLSWTRVLCEQQHLWSTAALSSRMAGFFASKLMRSRTAALDAAELPSLFQVPAFRGRVYRLDEPVLDTASLVRNLAEPHSELLLAAPGPRALDIRLSPASVNLLDGRGRSLELTSRRMVFLAGKGNGGLLGMVGHEQPTMQLRPLHMVMVRGALPTLYAHCLGASSVPRITISTHTDSHGRPVWYLGGQLAEEGVERSAEAQIRAAQGELAGLLPWLNLADAKWTTLRVDRAEVLHRGGQRPDDAFTHELDDVITGWPTKLALAPRLADAVIDRLKSAGVAPKRDFTAEEYARLSSWPRPEYAKLPWEEESRWN